MAKEKTPAQLKAEAKKELAKVKAKLFELEIEFDEDATLEDLKALLPLGSAEEEESDEQIKCVYRELLPGKKTIKSRKGAIAYKTFGNRKDAEKFVKLTGGKIVS